MLLVLTFMSSVLCCVLVDFHSMLLVLTFMSSFLYCVLVDFHSILLVQTFISSVCDISMVEILLIIHFMSIDIIFLFAPGKCLVD